MPACVFVSLEIVEFALCSLNMIIYLNIEFLYIQVTKHLE